MCRLELLILHTTTVTGQKMRTILTSQVVVICILSFFISLSNGAPQASDASYSASADANASASSSADSSSSSSADASSSSSADASSSSSDDASSSSSANTISSSLADVSSDSSADESSAISPETGSISVSDTSAATSADISSASAADASSGSLSASSVLASSDAGSVTLRDDSSISSAVASSASSADASPAYSADASSSPSADVSSSATSDAGSISSSDTSSTYLSDVNSASATNEKSSFAELSDKFAAAALSATQEANARASAKASSGVMNNSRHSAPQHGMEAVHLDDILPAHEGSQLHPMHDEYNGCKYDGEWQDCDPFKMIRIKEMRLIEGSYACVESKNITKPCSREDFPPGTVWLLKEHKKCILELQKLKIMVEDLHRYIDLIHQRGQSLFNAYNELRKKLMDIRKEISNLGRLNHASDQTIYRLKKEVEDWKIRSNKMQMDMNQLRAQYKQLEVDVRRQKIALTENMKVNQEAKTQKAQLSQKLYDISSVNRNLKSQLLDAERYREELREQMNSIAIYKKKTNAVNAEITKIRDKINQCKIDGLQTVQKIKKMPKFNKDTRVNLDMSMWITHNITQEAGAEIMNYQPLSYGQDPSTYQTTSTAAPLSEENPEASKMAEAAEAQANAVNAETSAYASQAAEAMSDATAHNEESVNEEERAKAEANDSD